jgi:hypothetical protein
VIENILKYDWIEASCIDIFAGFGIVAIDNLRYELNLVSSQQVVLFIDYVNSHAVKSKILREFTTKLSYFFSIAA